MVFITVADVQHKSLILCTGGCHSVTVCMYAVYVFGLPVVRFVVNRLIVRFSHDLTFLHQLTVYNHHATSFNAANLCGLQVILNSLLQLNELQEMQT